MRGVRGAALMGPEEHIVDVDDITITRNRYNGLVFIAQRDDWVSIAPDRLHALISAIEHAKDVTT